MIVAIPRGHLLRDWADGSGQIAALVIEIAINVGFRALSHFRRGWTVGAVSVDEEPWAGQRVLYREKFDGRDPHGRVSELASAVNSGALAVPQPRTVLIKRRP